MVTSYVCTYENVDIGRCCMCHCCFSVCVCVCVCEGESVCVTIRWLLRYHDHCIIDITTVVEEEESYEEFMMSSKDRLSLFNDNTLLLSQNRVLTYHHLSPHH